MKILALDSSSTNACVAILEEQTVLTQLNNQEEKTHSQKLMPMIDEAFQKAKISLDDINLIVCGLGPGSFTGVRIGIATAKAFVDSKKIPCVGISSLEGLAYNLNQEGYICSLINANHDNVYAGLFHLKYCNKNCFNMQSISTLQENILLQTLESDISFLDLKDSNGKLSSNKLLEFLENNSKVTLNNSPITFVGDAVIFYQNLLQNLPFEKNNEIHLACEEQGIISSISIAKAGYTKYKNGTYGNSNILSPIYLRKSQAELALN